MGGCPRTVGCGVVTSAPIRRLTGLAKRHVEKNKPEGGAAVDRRVRNPLGKASAVVGRPEGRRWFRRTSSACC